MSSPPVTQAFVDSIGACTYNVTYGCLLNAAGAARFPASSGGSAWVLASAGYSLSADAYATLHGATANMDGSYTAVTGAAFVLMPVAGAAETGTPPPPPPPPP